MVGGYLAWAGYRLMGLPLLIAAGLSLAGTGLIAVGATADNFALAQARGINGARIISWMWFLSGALGAVGGILLGMETQLRPSSGLSVLVPVFSAATVGGFGSAFGAVAGACLLA